MPNIAFGRPVWFLSAHLEIPFKHFALLSKSAFSALTCLIIATIDWTRLTGYKYAALNGVAAARGKKMLCLRAVHFWETWSFVNFVAWQMFSRVPSLVLATAILSSLVRSFVRFSDDFWQNCLSKVEVFRFPKFSPHFVNYYYAKRYLECNFVPAARAWQILRGAHVIWLSSSPSLLWVHPNTTISPKEVIDRSLGCLLVRSFVGSTTVVPWAINATTN